MKAEALNLPPWRVKEMAKARDSKAERQRLLRAFNNRQQIERWAGK